MSTNTLIWLAVIVVYAYIILTGKPKKKAAKKSVKKKAVKKKVAKKKATKKKAAKKKK